TAAAKSVNYYSDIFRARSPNLWSASVESYKLFLADRDLQQAAAAAPDELSSGASDSESRRRKRSSADAGLAMGAVRSPPQSMASSAQETPTSAMMTDFGSDATDDSSSDQQQLVAVAAHSWHKFLSLRSRWTSLGLQYASREDWERREMAFMAQHLLTLVDATTELQSEVTLTVVPQFAGSFDAANIEMAVGRSRTACCVRLATLVDDLLECIRQIDTREQFTMLSLCWLTDRATRTVGSLALLVSHGSSGQRFGAFPHNDPMFARLVAGSEGLWYEYSGMAERAALQLGALQTPPTPTPTQLQRDCEATNAAFSYAQNGLRYTFFTRRKGHFFEITRDEDWAPTMVPSRPRAVWAPENVSHEALLVRLRQDNEKLLAGMAELFGLRLFCCGFFESVASSGRPPPGSSRRISDDPSTMGTHRRSYSSLRQSRHRVSAGALPMSGNVSSGSNGSPYLGTTGSSLPYRRAPRAAGMSIDYHQLGGGGGGTGGLFPQPGRLGATGLLGHAGLAPPPAMPFLSPQLPQYLPLPSADLAMSMSLPNSPLFGLSADNGGQQPALAGYGNNGTPHDAAHLYPSLTDASLAAAMAATTSASSASLFLNASLGDLASIAATPAGHTPVLRDDALAVSMYPGDSALGSALASLGGVHVPSALGATPPAPRPDAARLDASTLFAGMAAAAAAGLPQSHGTPVGAPAFWDVPSAGLQQMQIAAAASPALGSLGAHVGGAAVQSSPLANAVSSSAAMVAAAAAAAAMGFDGQARIAAGGTPTSASVAIYPQPSSGGMAAWDGASAQPLSAVLGNTDMLMSMVRPTQTPTTVGTSALATPALDCLSGPHYSAAPASTKGGACTPSMAPMGVVGGLLGFPGDDGQSSMAAYFGSAGASCATSGALLQSAAMFFDRQAAPQPRVVVVPAPEDMQLEAELASTLYPGL
ncbi:hypothetical protein LPJ61_004580, partial [Coemansia biformis]